MRGHFNRRAAVARIACLALAGGVTAGELPPPPAPTAIPRLPAVTGGIGNTLLRGGPFSGDPSQTYLELYTSDLAASPDGFVYLTTVWEEGCMPAGIYRDGDALPEHANFKGPSSGEAVAVSDRHVVYAKDGGLDIFERTPGRGIAPDASRRVALGDPRPAVKGLALDEARDRVYWADGVQVRAARLSAGQPDPGFAITLARAAKLSVDSQGNLWVMQSSVKAGRAELPATAFGSEAASPSNGVGRAQAKGDHQTAFIPKDRENGYGGLDFGCAAPVCGLSWTVGTLDPKRFAEVRFEGSAVGPDGPWTELARFADTPCGWPDEYLTLDPSRPWRAVRIIGPGVCITNWKAYTPTPAQPGRVLRFDPAGRKLAGEITAIAAPVAMAYDARFDRLLVADGDTHQIVAFTGLDDRPRPDERFADKGRLGLPGGRHAGPSKENGIIGPLRFEELRGVGADALGNVAVCHVGASGINQTRLESYTAEGEPRWSMAGSAFLDMADADPTDMRVLFSCANEYRVDWSREEDPAWTWVASTLDAARYPDDARLAGCAQVYGVRRIHGQRFLIATTQGQMPLAIYRFDPARSGHAAIPCAVLRNFHSGAAWPPNQPPGFGPFLWRDRNGDGRMQADEYEKELRAEKWLSTAEIDSRGDLWVQISVRGRNGLQRLDRGEKLDGHGIPGWSWQSSRNRAYDVPEPLAGGKAQVRGIVVDAEHDAVFVFGFTEEFPNTVGRNCPLGRVLMRCAVREGRLDATHAIQLPYDCRMVDAEHDQPYAAALVGDVLFVGYERHMTVLAYRASDLALLGRLDIGEQSQAPIFDGPPELIAFKLRDGYGLTMPQYVGNAITVLRWNGKTTGWMPAPKPTLEIRGGGVTLSWAADGRAAGWVVDRRLLEPAGWSGWREAARLGGGVVSWRDERPGVSAAAYRVRALGLDGASDWSRTVYARGLARTP